MLYLRIEKNRKTTLQRGPCKEAREFIEADGPCVFVEIHSKSFHSTHGSIDYWNQIVYSDCRPSLQNVQCGSAAFDDDRSEAHPALQTDPALVTMSHCTRWPCFEIKRV